MEGISVITIVKDRKNALLNLSRGLSFNELKPDELIVVHMNEAPYSLGELPFEVRSIGFTSPINCPLAAARNKGADVARFDRLIFLDVDCIPAKDFISHFNNAWRDDSLLSGTIRYLSAEATDKTDVFDSLYEYSRPDPIRSDLRRLPYELFWSLNFGCCIDIFRKIGGFDESYLGYGAEDTDFSFAARHENVPLILLEAIAYHQHHAAFSPPLNHLCDIVPNAVLFYQKWNLWPMEGWLKQFAAMGLVHWKGDDLRLLRQPAPEELANAKKD